MKKLALLAASLSIGGCAATHTLPDPQIDTSGDYLPPISVMVDSPEHASELRNYLRGAGVFSKVDSGTGAKDGTSVLVQLDAQRDTAPFPLLLLSACTLFLLPMQNDLDTHADFAVMRDGKLIKHYRYSNYTTKYSWLLDTGAMDRSENIRRVARAFARDVQKDGLLAGNQVVAQ